MNFQVTALYASVLTILVIALSNVVSAQRARAKVSIRHGDDSSLALWIRRHGNLVENVPLALLLMMLCEARGLGAGVLHAMGILLIVARLAHLVGLDAARLTSPLRIAGGIGTQLVMLGAVAYLLWSMR